MDEAANRDCFSPPIPEIFQAADFLDRAVKAHLRGAKDEAENYINLSDMPEIGRWLDSIWLGGNTPIRAVRKITGLPPLLPEKERYHPRNPSATLKRDLVARDGHHCRFCSMPLVRAEIRRTLTNLYPKAARWTSTHHMDQHRGLQVMWLQYDHIVVHSRGGETSSYNMVVACPACNFGRDRYMLAEVGIRDPRVFPRSPAWSGYPNWDGLESLMPEAKRYEKRLEH